MNIEKKLNRLSGKNVYKIELVDEEILIHFTDGFILSVYASYDDWERPVQWVSIYDPDLPREDKWEYIKE